MSRFFEIERSASTDSVVSTARSEASTTTPNLFNEIQKLCQYVNTVTYTITGPKGLSSTALPSVIREIADEFQIKKPKFIRALKQFKIPEIRQWAEQALAAAESEYDAEVGKITSRAPKTSRNNRQSTLQAGVLVCAPMSAVPLSTLVQALRHEGRLFSATSDLLGLREYNNNTGCTANSSTMVSFFANFFRDASNTLTDGYYISRENVSPLLANMRVFLDQFDAEFRSTLDAENVSTTLSHFLSTLRDKIITGIAATAKQHSTQLEVLFA